MEYGKWASHPPWPDVTIVFGAAMPETTKPIRAESTVRVRATRSLDLMNENEVKEIDRDEQVDRLINAGYLVEVGENEPLTTPQTPYDTPNPTATVNTNGPQQEQAQETEQPAKPSRARR